MMIIGKYFERNEDYINVMKIAKKYHDLTAMYHFNPISDCELFENMESQFIYDENYFKKEGMHQYVYWYQLDRELEKNEVMKVHFYEIDNFVIN